MGSGHNEALERLDPFRSSVSNPYDIPVTLFAGADVPIEAEGIAQLRSFLDLQRTLDELWAREQKGQIAPFWGEGAGRIERVVLTPDFHRGAGIPVGTVALTRGFVIPAAVGNDVCCGMRLLATDVRADELDAHAPALARRLRELFFEGQRDIPMSPRQREALLRDGLFGLWDTSGDNAGRGIWAYYDARTQGDDLVRADRQGSLSAKAIFGFDKFVRSSGEIDGRDPQIGSVGGGNHFVELQRVDELYESTATDWGLGKNKVTVMVHTGSVGLGHMVGGHFCDQARRDFAPGVAHPDHGFYPLPAWGPRQGGAAAYLDALKNAANFAFGNRLFLGLMAIRAISEVLGRAVEHRLVYDAPHNLIWERGEGRYLHRKGATPAEGPAGGGPFATTGRPVLVPGSMGASSYVLAGHGDESALASACHGAGRALDRRASAQVDEETYRRALAPLRVVTPLDPDAPAVRLRADVLAKYHRRVKEEAPYAYKDVGPVIRTVEDAGVARRIARLWPLMTVKG
ncbi:MAG: RtcB family protein [Polyangiaceae bacterium]|nr:RtcB family protein [Polyangiaceae bacterium]